MIHSLPHPASVAAVIAALLAGAAVAIAAVLIAWPSSSQAPTPARDSFYDVPSAATVGRPGTIIRSRPLASTDAYELSAVVYRSRSAASKPVAVSGLVAVPTKKPPAGGFPVVSIAHGTTGFVDGTSAPSRSGQTGMPVSADQLFDGLVQQGYAVAMTDYEGLGLAGPVQYAVGRSEAHSVLDAARAARRLKGARVGRKVAIIGHSQGGHAALWASGLAGRYAPDVDLSAVVASAPGTDLAAGIRRRDYSPDAALNVLRLIGAWHEVYGLELAPLLTPAGIETVKRMMADEPVSVGSEHFRRHPDLGPLLRLARLNSPAPPPNGVPVLMLSGEADTHVPPGQHAAFARRARRAGSDLHLRVVPGADHSRTLLNSAGDIGAFLQARLDERARPR